MNVPDYIFRGLRRATATWRALPTILGIGAARSGTTALFSAMSRHPDVGAPSRKEIHFFDLHFHKGSNWYRAFFPFAPAATMEISPSYMNHPAAAERAARTLDDALIVAMLRDPVDRAWSQYRLRRKLGTEARSFEEILELEISEAPHPFTEYDAPARVPYLSAGLYADQLQPWLVLFGAERVLVLDSAEVFANPTPHLKAIQESAGLTPVQLPFERVNIAPSRVPPVTLERARLYFEESDERLRNMTGATFSWMTRT